MCITYSVLLCKLTTSSLTFEMFILSVKYGKYCHVDVIFEDIQHQLQGNILHHFLHFSFL